MFVRARACFHRSSSFLLVFVVLIVAGCGRPAVTDKAKEAPRVNVAHPVVRSLADEDDYNGWLEASQTVEVRARVRGHIQKVAFQDGDYVQKNQLLFQLDPRPFQVAIDETIADAKALEAQKIAAEKDAARQGILLKSNAASASDYEEAVANAQSYTARIAAKNQATEKYKLDLEFARITAPIAGRTSRAMLTLGNLVNAGGSEPLLTTIVAVDPIYVDFNVDERAIQRYQEIGAAKSGKGEKASIREEKMPFAFGLDTETGFPHQGNIVFADNKYTAGTGTILVRGEAKNPDGRLIAGSRVRVRIPVSDKRPATLVPDTAVNSDQTQKYLLLVGEGNVVKRQNVDLGRLLDDGMRVIMSKPELKADEWIIVEGMERARLDYPVEPIPESGPSPAPVTK
jgi:RND family efflux transporter MFP subunit